MFCQLDTWTAVSDALVNEKNNFAQMMHIQNGEMISIFKLSHNLRNRSQSLRPSTNMWQVSKFSLKLHPRKFNIKVSTEAGMPQSVISLVYGFLIVISTEALFFLF